MSISLPQLDFTYLDQMAMGDAQMRAMLLDLLPEELEDQAKALRSSLISDDAQRIFEAGHKLRSSLLFTGNEEALALNAKIEKAAKEGNLTEAMHQDANRLFVIILEIVKVLKIRSEND
jgi:HPt (histidine-containing phosphotransfer) domain-containing protein